MIQRLLLLVVLIPLAWASPTQPLRAVTTEYPTTAVQVEILMSDATFHQGHADIARLYGAFLGRSPEIGGLQFWMTNYTRGDWPSTRRIAQFFGSSPEFVEKYGTPTDEEIVELLYQNVFGRPPDAEGRSFWLNKLKSGTPRHEVLADFAFSNEYRLLNPYPSDGKPNTGPQPALPVCFVSSLISAGQDTIRGFDASPPGYWPYVPADGERVTPSPERCGSSLCFELTTTALVGDERHPEISRDQLALPYDVRFMRSAIAAGEVFLEMTYSLCNPGPGVNDEGIRQYLVKIEGDVVCQVGATDSEGDALCLGQSAEEGEQCGEVALSAVATPQQTDMWTYSYDGHRLVGKCQWIGDLLVGEGCTFQAAHVTFREDGNLFQNSALSGFPIVSERSPTEVDSFVAPDGSGLVRFDCGWAPEGFDFNVDIVVANL